jgi:hypothetical protein
MVAALRQRHLPDHVLKVALGDSGQAVGLCEGFSGRKLRVVTPAAAMLAGIVDGGVVRRDPLEGVGVELFSYRLCPGVAGGKSRFFLFFIVYL